MQFFSIVLTGWTICSISFCLGFDSLKLSVGILFIDWNPSCHTSVPQALEAILIVFDTSSIYSEVVRHLSCSVDRYWQHPHVSWSWKKIKILLSYRVNLITPCSWDTCMNQQYILIYYAVSQHTKSQWLYNWTDRISRMMANLNLPLSL